MSSLGNVGVVATDTNGNTATGTVNLTVKDDTPKADLVAQTVVATAAKTNVMVILDLSGEHGHCRAWIDRSLSPGRGQGSD